MGCRSHCRSCRCCLTFHCCLSDVFLQRENKKLVTSNHIIINNYYYSALVLDMIFFYYMEVSTFIVVTSAAILQYRIFLASFSFPPLLISANACNFFKVLQLFNIVECGQIAFQSALKCES